MDWLLLTQDRYWWRAPLKAVINTQVPLIPGNFLVGWRPVSF